MAKEKTVELKTKAEKISAEHLKELQDIINTINQVQFNIGKLEAQKHNLLHDLAVTQNKVALMQDTLNKEYGNDDVNINDGTINWKKDEK
tara:strand:- start:558 stop:827 length:270 start_codon:yes stop_codon:yes gene_type:complete